MNVLSGSCQCGSVRFSAPLPCKWVAHCHCSMCRRAHGAAFVTWVGTQAGTVEINDAQSVLRWYASSADAERGFCSRCGSPLFFRSRRWADELHIARAQIDLDIDCPPQLHVFWANHVDWGRPDPNDGLPRKDEV